MSDVIKLLPDSVANQIAAGEVIQRPASVIKELVENAIDAEATKIDIVLIDAGRTLIQVVDNGKGMSETDARLSFERHATSKIRKADDLFALHTMGFRGEALASIAAISQVELRTRLRGAAMGTRLEINACQCEQQVADYCPEGCNFMIKNLFFNVPARRKFLKSNQVELSNILREFERLALVNYTTEFTLTHNGSLMYQLMGSDSFKQRIAALFSHSIDKQLIPIETETSMVRLYGFISRPENARKRGALQYLFVNGRHMRHPFFHKAIMQCYEQLIPADEQPNYFLHFSVDAETIDVNIHPTKNEIKFENELAIRQILFAAVKEALGKFSAVPSIDFDNDDAPEIPAGEVATAELRMPEIEVDPNYNPFASSSRRPATSSSSSTTYHTAPRMVDASLDNWQSLYDNFERKRSETIEQVVTTAPREISADTNPIFITEEKDFSVSSFIQIKNRYIGVPSESGLMLIDQNKAHIRVLFERLMEAKQAHQIESQRVLFPEVITLSAPQNLILEDLKDEMENMGFELSFLGDNSWSVCSTPAILRGINAKELLLDVVDTATEGANDIASRITEHVALSSAKAAAIGYGRKLKQEEIEALVADLFRCKEPNFTPNGYKTMVIISGDELQKMFS